MDEKKTEQPEIRVRGSIWVWIAVPLTVVYLAVLWSLITVTEACDPAVVGIVAQYLGCKSVNELGDFLAGAFAPLAFLWLVVAVLVQAQELKSQRAELALTRAEMKLNREVASSTREEIAAQATAAKANAEFVRQQTDILKREADREDKRIAAERFDGLLRLADTLIRTRIAAQVMLGTSPHDGYSLLPAEKWADDVQRNLVTASVRMRETINERRAELESGQRWMSSPYASRRVREFADLLTEIRNLSTSVDHMQPLLDAMQIEEWLLELDHLLGLPNNV